MFGKKRRAEKARLEEFKESIKGIFNDWKVNNSTIDKGGYSIWIHHGYSGFRDYEGLFLVSFSKKERKLLWEEFQNRGYPSSRHKVFKEFNLKGFEPKGGK